MTEPHFAKTPTEILSTFTAWLEQLKQRSAENEATGAKTAGATTRTIERAIRIPIDRGQSGRYLTEHPILLRSGDANIFGIVTEPRADDLRLRAVILLNVGAEHHIGSSRMYVTLARRWAQHGYTVFRLDLAGIGDSETRPNRPDIEVFPPDALEDISCAVNYVRERYGVREVTLSGLCSGAYHSLQAAIGGLPIDRLLLVNPMNFLWSAGMSAEALQQSVDVSRNLEFLRQRVFSTSIWRRILTGQISLWRIMRIMLQRPVLAVASRLRDFARAVGIRLPRDLGSHLEELCARGIRLAFVFSRGEPGLDVLKLQAGSTVAKLGDRCRVYIVDSGDHIFSHKQSRILLETILSEQLYEVSPRRVQMKTTAHMP
jgi:pimeloyl-ACP methyl ester carboxylesterase